MDFKKVEEKWQERWRKAKIFEPEIDKKKPFYIQVAYPYPSGAMHIGHARTYTMVDIVLRYKKMKGFNTLMPMGWHVSGTPVISSVELIKNKDEKTLKTMKEVFKIPEKDLHELETAEGFVDYFVNKASTGYKAGFKKLGLGIDWRRELTTMDKHYNKFIEWQYKKLYAKGYVIKKEHPVRYCNHDKHSLGDHDLKEGQGIGIQEYVLLKFKFEDKYIIAATLRPETVFGQTNLWINPDIDYVKALVDGEEWILSQEAFEKLEDQKKKVEKAGEVHGRDLVGKYALAPGIDKEIIILPSFFCNPAIGTGIVTSVPSDAPIDYMALIDLKKDKRMCEEFGLDYNEIKSIEVIPIIETEKYGNLAAEKVCKELKIKNQFDSNLEEAKKRVYREGFHKGKMNENTGRYKRMRVEKAKDKVKNELIDKNQADVLYELEGLVICRCGNEAVVKVLDDQWFIKYSDDRWKEESRDTLKNMNIVPEAFRHQYETVFNWLEDKPCTRSKGLGTKFPWDKSQIVEPLGDSTIYMAYFTISHIIKEMDEDKLDDDVFDYIFLNRGDVKKIARKKDLDVKKLEDMRNEFNYWYPLMFNASAIELIPNHMSFSIFQHTSIFPKTRRQNGTLNLGMLVIEGEKMSSSKGNVVLIEDITKDIGADMVRFFLMNFVEPWQEANWKARDVETGVKSLKSFVDKLEKLAGKVNVEIKNVNLTRDDKWILSRFNSRLKAASDAMEEYQLRKFLQEVCFGFLNDLKKYERKIKKIEDNNKAVHNYLFSNWAKIMSPFMPHICEELWERLGNKNLLCLEKWPKHEDRRINEEIEASEDLIDKVVEDVRNVLELIKIKKPKEASLFVADKWKYSFMKKVKKEIEKSRDVKVIMKKVRDKKHSKEISKIVPSLLKDVSKVPQYVFDQNKEIEFLEENKEFFEKEFKLKFNIFKEEESKEEKAKNSLPMKPAIIIS